MEILRKRWLDREQELIAVIQEETKCTEENEEAGYRSPTWLTLRALQKTNEAKRLEAEAVMSASPFFQSAGRGHLKFWGEDDGPTVVVWESLSEPEQKNDKNRGKGKSVRWKVWWRQGNIKCAVSEEYSSCWVHQSCHVADEKKAALKKVAGVSGKKDECQVRLKGRKRDYWMGTEIGMLGGYEFQGQVRQVMVQTKKAKWELDIIT